MDGAGNTPKTKKKWYQRKIVWVIAVVVLIAAIATGGSQDQDNETAQNNEVSNNQTAQEENTETTEAPEEPEAEFAFDDGTHVVGEDIQPGTYRTHGDDGSSFGCYWARLSGFSGELDEIIANNGSYESGSQVITIEATDAGFETTGCGKWYAELTQVTDSKTTFSSGTMIVGTDIEPGTYRNEGAESEFSCYWARLSGFSGELDEIIANDNAQNTVVTIAETDKGFSSSGCGTWTKQ